MGRMTLTTPTMRYFVVQRLALKFGDSCFSYCGDMIADIKTDNESSDSDHAPFKDALSSTAWDLLTVNTQVHK